MMDVIEDASSRNSFRNRLRTNNLTWILLSVIVMLAILLAITLVSFLVRSPNEVAIANSRVVPVVTAKVERKTFNLTPIEVEGTASTGATENVTATGTVTAMNVAASQSLLSGQVIGRVDGNPVIALHMPFKLYRDINEGDKGDDVRELQRSLQALGLYRGRVDGVYGQSTARAVQLLYARNSVSAPQAPIPEEQDKAAETDPGKSTTADSDSATGVDQPPAKRMLNPVLKSGIYAIPTPQATVVSVASVGAVLSDAQPLLTLKLGNPSVTMRVNTSESGSFPVGQAVEITDLTQGKIVAQGTVATVGEFTASGVEGSSEVKPGYDVNISITKNDGLTDEEKVSVSPIGTQSKQTAICVPATALREIGGKTYVTLRKRTQKNGSNVTEQRAEVIVDQVIDGWALLSARSQPKLEVGQDVVVAVQK